MGCICGVVMVVGGGVVGSGQLSGGPLDPSAQ